MSAFPRRSELAHHWSLDPNTVFLNHGSFGACPKAVLEKQERLRAQIESDPVRFYEIEGDEMWAESLDVLSEFLNADSAGMAFVPNATGIKMWFSSSEFTDLDKKTRSHAWREIFSSAFITTALNPKSIVFFLAFIPQFIEPELPFTTQVVILGATFFVLAIISVLGYAALAIYAGQQLHLPLIQRWTHRIGGGLLIGAGGMTAVTS